MAVCIPPNAVNGHQVHHHHHHVVWTNTEETLRAQSLWALDICLGREMVMVQGSVCTCQASFNLNQNEKSVQIRMRRRMCTLSSILRVFGCSFLFKHLKNGNLKPHQNWMNVRAWSNQIDSLCYALDGLYNKYLMFEPPSLGQIGRGCIQWQRTCFL